MRALRKKKKKNYFVARAIANTQSGPTHIPARLLAKFSFDRFFFFFFYVRPFAATKSSADQQKTIARAGRITIRPCASRVSYEFWGKCALSYRPQRHANLSDKYKKRECARPRIHICARASLSSSRIGGRAKKQRRGAAANFDGNKWRLGLFGFSEGRMDFSI